MVCCFVYGVSSCNNHTMYLLRSISYSNSCILFFKVDSFHDPVCKSAGWSCQDCFTMKLCVNFFGWQNWNQMSCVDKVNSNGKPFCNQVTNVCEEKPSGDCDPSSKFVCTRDGNYPNINNCGKYLQCSDGNLTTVECPTNYVYDHVHGSCVFKLTSSDCKTIRCTNNNYGIVIYLIIAAVTCT